MFNWIILSLISISKLQKTPDEKAIVCEIPVCKHYNLSLTVYTYLFNSSLSRMQRYKDDVPLSVQLGIATNYLIPLSHTCQKR